MKLSTEELAKLEELDKMNQEEWFITCAHLGAGDSFGELALINDEPRAATIQCLNECYFATLDK
jgi:CRP-like cAMP-binding protein